MNKHELIEKYENMFEELENYLCVSRMRISEKIQKLYELPKVTIPQFVADFIAEQKKLGHTLSYSIDACMSDIVAEWYWDNSQSFARAWIDGYIVDGEKLYTVKVKATEEYLCNDQLGPRFSRRYRANLRKVDLEELGFGWVFDCPGIEIEEVD